MQSVVINQKIKSSISIERAPNRKLLEFPYCKYLEGLRFNEAFCKIIWMSQTNRKNMNNKSRKNSSEKCSLDCKDWEYHF